MHDWKLVSNSLLIVTYLYCFSNPLLHPYYTTPLSLGSVKIAHITHLCVQSLVNEAQLAIIEDEARKTQSAFDQGQFTKATQLWSATEDVVEEVSLL